MNPRQAVLHLIRVCSDISLICLAWVLAYYIRFYTGIEAPKGIPAMSLYIKIIPFLAVICFFAFNFTGFYKRSGKHRSALIEAADVIQSVMIATLAFIAFSYFYKEYRYSRITLGIFAVITPIFIISGRSFIRKLLRRYRKNKPPRSVLFIGNAEKLKDTNEIISFLETDNSKITAAIFIGDDKTDSDQWEYQVFQTPESWAEFLTKHEFQSIVISLSHKDYHYLDQHLDAISNQVTEIKILPDIYKHTKFSPGIELIRGTPVVSMHESPLVGFGSILKRVLDIAGSIVALSIFLPLMVLLAALVRLSSRGPIFYKQERMGIDGKTFEMLKFRSMPVDAEKKSGAVWAKAGESRATPIGSMLRKTSLDELPQLFNVLKGEMSLVGPRPERPVFVNEFRKNIPGYMLRHKVKAGMTGWAQINGWRGNTSIEKRIECDLFYIQNWSLWLDIKILLLTVIKGFISKNAY